MIKLWGENIPGFINGTEDGKPSITPYLYKEGAKRPAMLIVPGGSYSYRSYHEGEPAAGWMNSMGISAFVLNYRVSPYRYPYPQMDILRAVSLLRLRYNEFNIDPDKIGVMGFSAGGHLAACACTMFDDKSLALDDETGKTSSRPDLAVLAYPVITMGMYTHKESRENILGKDFNDALVKKCSMEKQVNSDTCATFIWHTAEDQTVPVQNSLLMASALAEHGIPYELHVFNKGRHGLGIKGEVPQTKKWMELCEKWLKNNNF